MLTHFHKKDLKTIIIIMKVYFAGSIRGGRIDANLYERLIKYIQKTDIVLTEHVGNLNLSEEGQTVSDIYNQDTTWLRESDVLIAERVIFDSRHAVGNGDGSKSCTVAERLIAKYPYNDRINTRLDERKSDYGQKDASISRPFDFLF